MRLDEIQPRLASAGTLDKQGVITTPVSTDTVSASDSSGQDAASNSALRSTAMQLLKEASATERTRYKLSKQVLTYDEYLVEVLKNPRKYIRNAFQYAVDAIDYWDNKFGGNATQDVMGSSVKPFAFARKPWLPDILKKKGIICGQELVLDEIYQTLKLNPKGVNLLHGPNGTAKTLIIETLFEAIEEYSKTDEGALYSVNWVSKDAQRDDSENTFEYLFPTYAGPNKLRSSEDQPIRPSEVGGTIPYGYMMNVDPIFLLSRDLRLKLLDSLKKNGNLPSDLDIDYLISGELEGGSQKIFDAFSNIYDKNLRKVLNHVHVVRLPFSVKRRQGLVIIPAERTPEAVIEEITPDIDWSKFSPKLKEALRAAGIYRLKGSFPSANRGHVCWDDMFKSGDISRHLFLFRTGNKGIITASGPGGEAIDERINEGIWGTTNDENLGKLQAAYPDWKSFRQRVRTIPVGYERRYHKIAEIFQEQLDELIPASSGRHISPGVLDSFALWISMTYLFPPNNPRYYDTVDENPNKTLSNLVTQKLTILEKALLYEKEDLNAYYINPGERRYTSEEQATLRKHLADIRKEYGYGVGRSRFNFYEGQRGLSINDARRILEDCIRLKPDECFTDVELFEAVDEWVKHGSTDNEILTYKTEIQQAREKALKLAEEAAGIDKKNSWWGTTSESSSLEDLYIPKIPEFPPLKQLLDSSKFYKQRKIRYEVNSALEFVKSGEEYTNDLAIYVAHVIASGKGSSVEERFRQASNASSPNALPNEHMMQKVEEVLMAKKDTEDGISKSMFRDGIVKTFGQWKEKLENKGKDPYKHITEIFPEYVATLKAKNIQDNKKRLVNFLVDLIAFCLGEKSFDGSAVRDEDRVTLFHKGLNGLKEKGYCEKCIPKLVKFAFDDPKYYEQENEAEKSLGAGV